MLETISGTALYLIAATFCPTERAGFPPDQCETAAEMVVRFETLYPDRPEWNAQPIACDYFAEKLRDRYIWLGGAPAPRTGDTYPDLSGEWEVTSAYCEKVLPFEARQFLEGH